MFPLKAKNVFLEITEISFILTTLVLNLGTTIPVESKTGLAKSNESLPYSYSTELPCQLLISL